MSSKDEIVVKVFLKDEKYKKESVKKALKVFSMAFGVFFLYFLYQLFALFFAFPKIPAPFFWALLVVITGMTSMTAILYAVGSGFEKANEIEKASRKTKIIFSERGIDFFNGLDCDERNWSDFAKIKETPDGFYIYPNGENRFYIPGYAFQTREDINGFRTIVRLRLGRKAKLKL